MDCLTADFEKNVRTLDALLGVGRCFDMISRDLYVGGNARGCGSWTATAMTQSLSGC